MVILVISQVLKVIIGSNGFRDSNVNRSVLIRRASMNSHDWVGGISNLEYYKGNWKTSVGVDLRNYTGYHYRALNNSNGIRWILLNR